MSTARNASLDSAAVALGSNSARTAFQSTPPSVASQCESRTVVHTASKVAALVAAFVAGEGDGAVVDVVVFDAAGLKVAASVVAPFVVASTVAARSSGAQCAMDSAAIRMTSGGTQGTREAME